MIADALINTVFSLVNLALSPISGLSWDFDNTKMDTILEILSMVFYIVPFQQLMPIFIFFVGMMAFRIAVRLIKTIWEILPVV